MNDPESMPNEPDIEYVRNELSAHMEQVQGELGARLRAARVAQRLGLRELSRRVGVSASMVSQLERGTVMPSVATLYRLVSELGISLDELFSAEDVDPADHAEDADAADDDGAEAEAEEPAPVRRRALAFSPVQRKDSRLTVALDTGVVWQRLTAAPDSEVEFLWSHYPVGGESCPPDALLRHSGREFGYVEKGRLGVTLGFETYELDPGDSISFESAIPHRVFALGGQPAEVVWVVLGRRGDPHAGR
jgi:transcriptional regulator with XRE-family HTH domain